jgi:stage III sporulation protein AB
MGQKLASKYQDRTDELLTIKSRMATLESQIVFFKAPLAQAIKQATKNENKCIDDILQRVNDQLSDYSNNQPFCLLWKEAIQQRGKKTVLKQDTLEALIQLGAFIENTHHDQQAKGFEMVSQLINRQYDQAESERKKNQTLYLKLSLLIGVGLVICLI